SLFRRHVIYRSHNPSWFGLNHKLRRSFSIRVIPGLISQFRETKIEDLNVAITADHDIFGFNISMDNSRFVSRGQGRGDLYGDVDHLVNIERIDPPSLA